MLHDVKNWLAEANARVRNAWLLTAVLLVALVCAVETTQAIMTDGLAVSSGLLAMVLVASTVLMAFRPADGCLLTALLYAVLYVMMMLGVAWLPSGSLLIALLAIGIAGYIFKWFGTVLLAVTVVIWSLGLTNVGSSAHIDSASGSSEALFDASDSAGSSDLADSGKTDTSSTTDGSDGTDTTTVDSTTENKPRQVILSVITIDGAMPVTVLAIGGLLAGVAARWNRERNVAQIELEHRRRRERVARDIHDYVSNDLAYLILRFDKDIADGSSLSIQELRELRDVAVGALDRTHQVISMMEGRTNTPDSINKPSSQSNGTSVVTSSDGDSAESVDEHSQGDRDSRDDRGSQGDQGSGNSHNRGRSRWSSWDQNSSNTRSSNNSEIPLSVTGQQEYAQECGPTYSNKHEFVQRIRDIVAAGDCRLSELGCNGQSIVSVAASVAEDELILTNRRFSDIIDGFLEELYGNIIKHADLTCGYVITVNIGLDAVHIACTDTPRKRNATESGSNTVETTVSNPDKPQVSEHAHEKCDSEVRSLFSASGTGLNRYRNLLEEHNGVLHITAQDAEWTLSAIMPYSMGNSDN